MFSKTLLKTRSPARNARDFTCLLSRFVSICWYDAIRKASASQSLSVISKSLVMASTLAFQGFKFKVWAPQSCRNYGLHPIGKGERGYPSWLSTSCSIGPKNLG